MRARHRLSKLLLRHGLIFEGAAWTQAHQRWLHGLRLELPGLGVTFDEADGAVLAVQARRDRLDGRSPSWRRPHRGRHWSAGWAACVGLGC